MTSTPPSLNNLIRAPIIAPGLLPQIQPEDFFPADFHARMSLLFGPDSELGKRMAEISARVLHAYHVDVSPLFVNLTERLAHPPSTPAPTPAIVTGTASLEATVEITAVGVVTPANSGSAPLTVTGLLQALTFLSGAIAAFELGANLPQPRPGRTAGRDCGVAAVRGDLPVLDGADRRRRGLMNT